MERPKLEASIDLIQRSPEWFAVRGGRLTSSKIGDALSTLKRSGERTKTAVDVMWELAAERETGVPAKRVNALAWGLQHEDQARASYAFLTNAEIKQVGFIPHPTIANAGCSPDALIGADGALEIKAPTSATHLQTLLTGAVPEEHFPQLHWVLACTAREWIDFVSYDPRFQKPEMRFFQQRVMRDEAAIAVLEKGAVDFLGELDAIIDAICARFPSEAAA
jgi:YqaJ-like recombinase protein